MIHTSFLDVIAADGTEQHRLAHRAAILSQTRVNRMFGSFIASQDTALDYLSEEIATVVASACEEVGYDDVEGTLAVVLADAKEKKENPFAKKDDDDKDSDDDDKGDKKDNSFPFNRKKDKDSDDDSDDSDDDSDDDCDDKKTSSVHTSRKPKMCPFHKEVVNISLAQGEPRAGFDTMSQHWGGPRHCEGEGYEGSKCNFKPQMTTQSFWDEKAEQAEQRKQERLDQAAELEAQQPTLESPTEDISDETIDDGFDSGEGAEVIDFPSEPSAIGEGVDTTPEALQVAAKTAADDGLGGKGTPSPKIDKQKWTPKSVPEIPLEGDDSRNPTTRVDIAPSGYENTKELTGIGENKTEHVSLPSSDNAGFSDGGEVGKGQGGTWTVKSPSAVTAASPHDPDKNGIVEIMENNYDDLLPQLELEKALIAHRS